MHSWRHGRMPRFLATVSALCLIMTAAPAFAGCGDRPGTPVNMTATQSDNQILLDFTNTATEAPIYWDIEVTDGAGHGLAGGAAGVRGTRTKAEGGAYSELGRFQLAPIQGGNYKPNTTYCFRVRARTAGGTQGCVSKIWNNPVCVTTPDTAVNQFCSTYARDAINQLNYLRNVKMAGNCGDEGARWTSTWLEHYNWCIAVRANPQSAGAPDFERSERNKRLQVCSGYSCLNNVCKQIRSTGKAKPTTPTPTPPPPPPPKPPENQCKYTVSISNDECVQGDGGPMTSNPPGRMNTFGCGATEEEALSRAKLAFYVEGGPELSDDDPPCPGCCTYKKKVTKGCACPVRTYSKKVEEKPCLRGMIRTAAGSCRCPPGTRWAGSWCRRFGATTPAPPPATSPTRPPTTPPPAPCPSTRPVGTPPNCCPTGTVFGDGVCRQAAKPTPSTSGGGTITSGGGETGDVCPRSRPVGTYPHCCPKGMTFRGRMCRHDYSRKTAPNGGGGGSNGIDPGGGTGPCPSSRPVGTPPNCCPSGTSFRGGMCRRDASPATVPSGGGGSNGIDPGKGSGPCPSARPVGTPPNCCPPGTRFQNGKCKRPTSTPTPTPTPEPTPTPTPAPTPTPTPTPKCTGGRIGTPPNCFCRPPQRLFRGRCRTMPKPAPTPKPNDDKVIVR